MGAVLQQFLILPHELLTIEMSAYGTENNKIKNNLIYAAISVRFFLGGGGCLFVWLGFFLGGGAFFLSHYFFVFFDY